jgi:hypothetical protein
MQSHYEERYSSIWFDFIFDHCHLIKDLDVLSKSKLLTWNLFLKYKNNVKFKWNMKFISVHPMVTWDLVLKHKDLEWNYDYLALNENIDWSIISKNFNKFSNFQKHSFRIITYACSGLVHQRCKTGVKHAGTLPNAINLLL